MQKIPKFEQDHQKKCWIDVVQLWNFFLVHTFVFFFWYIHLYFFFGTYICIFFLVS